MVNYEGVARFAHCKGYDEFHTYGPRCPSCIVELVHELEIRTTRCACGAHYLPNMWLGQGLCLSVECEKVRRATQDLKPD